MAINLTAKQVYEFTLQQTAAESFLSIAGPTFEAGDDLTRALKLGSNNPAFFSRPNDENRSDLAGKTRMTNEQIRDFNANYVIIAHQANTASGFSGTLFQKVTRNASGVITSRGDYTLSFRSTEFADDDKGGDWSRDGVAGADGEMASYGFALAQIADAEGFFRRLQSEGKLHSGARYNVTGYSLGGHIATVFTEAHKNDPNLLRTYLFNAPGRGGLPDRGPDTVKQFVDALYTAYNTAGFVLIDGVGQSTGARQDVYNGAALRDSYSAVRQAIIEQWYPSGASAFGGVAGAIEANNLITNIIGTTDYEDITITAKIGNRTSDILKVFIEEKWSRKSEQRYKWKLWA